MIPLADHTGPGFFARLGMMMELNPSVERTFDTSRKNTHKEKRVRASASLWHKKAAANKNSDGPHPPSHEGHCTSGSRPSLNNVQLAFLSVRALLLEPTRSINLIRSNSLQTFVSQWRT
jgi:hypothetical protein